MSEQLYMTSDTELRALAEAATLGPWHCQLETDYENLGVKYVTGVKATNENEWIVRFDDDYGNDQAANAAYIAAADPQTVLALLDSRDQWQARAERALQDARMAMYALIGDRVISNAPGNWAAFEDDMNAAFDALAAVTAHAVEAAEARDVPQGLDVGLARVRAMEGSGW